MTATSDERWAGLAVAPKEQRACCVAKRDDLNRLPIGWCGPDREGRTSHLAFLAAQRRMRPPVGTEVLELLAAGPLAIGDISEALICSWGCAHGLVTFLAESGLIEVVGERRGYRLGAPARLWGLAS